jgi:hypothetical protein
LDCGDGIAAFWSLSSLRSDLERDSASTLNAAVQCRASYRVPPPGAHRWRPGQAELIMRTTRTFTAFFVSAFLCLYAASGYAHAQADSKHWKWCAPALEGKDTALSPLSLSPASSHFTMRGSGDMSDIFPALPAVASPPNATTIPGEQTAPTSGPAGAEGPRFRDFGRALGYNFTRG